MTPERYTRVRTVLDRRQPDLTVLLDDVHKPHNFSAVVRTCDAVGVFEANAVWPHGTLKPRHMISGGAGPWVRVATHATCEEGIARLRGRGLRIVAAHPGAGSEDFREHDYTAPLCLLLGSERTGVSDEALAAVDARVTVPMLGMGTSLNVSVAAAIILFEAQGQRAAAGLYAACRIEAETYRRTLFEWLHPVVARYCRRYQRAYPRLREDGEIAEEFRA